MKRPDFNFGKKFTTRKPPSTGEEGGKKLQAGTRGALTVRSKKLKITLPRISK